MTNLYGKLLNVDIHTDEKNNWKLKITISKKTNCNLCKKRKKNNINKSISNTAAQHPQSLQEAKQAPAGLIGQGNFFKTLTKRLLFLSSPPPPQKKQKGTANNCLVMTLTKSLSLKVPRY